MACKICLGFFLAICISLTVARVWDIEIPRKLQDCYNLVQHADIQTYVGSTYSWLCEGVINNMAKGNSPQFEPHKNQFYSQLYNKSTEFSKLSGTSPKCVRKEYRTLTDDERRRFHEAVNAMKRDTSVEPNKYDAIALLHSGLPSFTAHGGAGFPGWHRIFILMFETALREIDPLVCLPYWDSSIDNELDDPRLSSVWTSQFFGTAQGPVVDGPFANWNTPDGSQLIRNVGSDGELFTSTAIQDILSRTRHQEILTLPEVEPRYDLEFHHAAVHVFCGGAMGQLDTAAFDPIFFLHHAFVDYIWELFRTNMRSQGLDPEQYPDIAGMDSRHHSTYPTGFSNLTHADGYLDIMQETYDYEPTPTCSINSPDCNSRYLRCQVKTGRCIPITQNTIRAPVPTLPVLNDIFTPTTGSSHDKSSPSPCDTRTSKVYGLPVQNDFCCDKTCDTSEWVMIPVKVVNVRPPKFNTYQSYPVHKGQIDQREDIYSPSAYSQTNRYISSRQSNPKTYKRCGGDGSIGQVYLSSKGINYDGFYKEAAIVDQRLAVSISMGFVSVKNPRRSSTGVSKALLRAHDSCGRVCHAACKDPITQDFKDCSGAVAISAEAPLMYGSSYDEAVLSVFDFEFNSDCPKFKTENFFITFYCDYHDDFPYAEHSHTPRQAPPVVDPRPPPAVMPSSSGCQVSQHCVLDVPCLSPTRQCRLYNERHACRGSCGTYAICTFGRFFTRQCPEGHYFDDNIKICVVGNCLRSPSDSVQNFPAGISMLPPAIQRIRGYPNLLQDNSLAAFRNRSPTVLNFYSHFLSGNSRNFG